MSFLATISSSMQVFPNMVLVQYISIIKCRLLATVSHISPKRYLLYAVYILKINKVGLLTSLKLGKYVLIFDGKVKVGFEIPIDPK